MFRFLARRLILTIPTFIALMFVTFMLIRLVPVSYTHLTLPTILRV